MRKTFLTVVSCLLALAVYASAAEINSRSNDLASLPAAAQASISAALARDFASDESDATAANSFLQLAKLTPSDGVHLGFFGVSVAMSGNTVVVGMNSTSIPGTVYVFEKPATGWDNMTQVAKLTASDGTANNALGYSVAISGNTIVAGAPNADGYLGAAYVFVAPATGWADMTETAKLTASDTFSALGSSVGISGNTIVVGSPDGSDFLAGAAYVYVKPTAGWVTATQTARLRPSDGRTYDEFGFSVAISGNTIVASALNRTEVYLYVEPSGGWGNMTQSARLLAPVTGFSVGIGGDTVVVGNPYATIGSNYAQGSAYIFVEPASGWANMKQPTATLTASDGAAGDWFGYEVAINGSHFVTGAPFATIGSETDQGAAYSFSRPSTGWKTTSHFNAKVVASDGAKGDEFGWSVALGGNMVLAGAPGATSQHGASYLSGP
jgi:hypothetical protein